MTRGPGRGGPGGALLTSRGAQGQAIGTTRFSGFHVYIAMVKHGKTWSNHCKMVVFHGVLMGFDWVYYLW